MSISNNSFYNRKIFIYGLARTGLATLNFLKNKNNQIICWDDESKIRKKIKKKYLLKSLKQLKKISFDFIVISPGIDKKNCPIKNFLNENKKIIITDLDIFYSFNRSNKIISITGTNGKSTTCKLLYEILKGAGYQVQLGGNIGKPVLALKKKKRKSITILELSSYQLDYTRNFRSNHAAILNISPDHIERHKSIKNYINVKKKIFKFQKKSDYAYLSNKNKYFTKIKKNFYSKIKLVNLINFNHLKKYINNNYLLTKNNQENLLFVFEILKKFKVSKKLIFEVINKFNGLPHRQERVYFGKKIICINDSKATSFESTKQALINYKNIFWIVGGIPKKNDKIKLSIYKKNIIKAYIIGKNTSFFVNQLKKEINYLKCINLSSAFFKIVEDIINFRKKKLNLLTPTILLSPSAASFDAYKNFEQRGDHFKILFEKNKNKLINV